jgi:proteic killer suppression protein
VILNFKHKGLERLYSSSSSKGINVEHVKKIERILARLDVASRPEMVNLPGWRLHRLKGNFAEFWSITISGNWRIIFKFVGENVADVDLVDYH